MKNHQGFKLNFMLIFLAIITVTFTVSLCAITAHKAIQQTFTANYLKINQQHSQKLASSTKVFLHDMQDNLNISANILNQDSPNDLQKQLDKQWQLQKINFDSMQYIDENYKILAVSPSASGIHIGDTLQKEAITEASQQQLFISDPYTDKAGKTLILISVPIFNEFGQFKGSLKATINMHNQNILHYLFVQNFNFSNSYAYIINPKGEIIFHPNKSLIGSIEKNDMLKEVNNVQSGSNQFINCEQHSILAGYTLETDTNWKIIVATPSSIVKNQTNEIIQRMVELALPFFIIILFLCILLAFRISKPLAMITKFCENIIQKKGDPNIQMPPVKSIIYEVMQLSQNLQLAVKELRRHIHQLDVDIQTDALTGIANRRTFDLSINEQIEKKIAFSLIFLDIDFFKKVNDTYGHVVGDEVLKFLAQIMQQNIRKEDFCFRYGGEEFAIIVPFGDNDTAYTIAEHLRTKLEHTPCPTGEIIHISLGIAVYPDHGRTAKELIDAADHAMYHSKSTGRNKTTIYSPSESNKT